MKKIVTGFVVLLICIVIMTMSQGLSANAGLYLDDIVKNKQFFGNFNNDTYLTYRIEGDSKVGMVFSVTCSFVSIYLGCTSYGDDIGSLTITLYEWKGSYKDTIESEPVHQRRWENFRNNWLIGCEMNHVIPEGVYYVELSAPLDESGSGVGVWAGKKYRGQQVYVNGKYAEDTCLRAFIEYTNAPPSEYGELPEVVDIGTPNLNKEAPKAPNPTPAKEPLKAYVPLTDMSSGSCESVISTCPAAVIGLIISAAFCFKKKN